MFLLVHFGKKKKPVRAGQRTSYWDHSESRTILQKLSLKQKRSDHITPILPELHWLPVDMRIDYKILFLVYSCIIIIIIIKFSDSLTKWLASWSCGVRERGTSISLRTPPPPPHPPLRLTTLPRLFAFPFTNRIQQSQFFTVVVLAPLRINPLPSRPKSK